METAKEKVQQALDKCEQSNVSEWSVIKSAVRDSLGIFLYEINTQTDDFAYYNGDLML